MKTITFEKSWRPSFELYAGVFWLLGALTSLLIGIYGNYGIRFMLLSTIPMVFFFVYRTYQGLVRLNKRARLFQLNPLKIELEEVIKWQQDHPDQVWYGNGYYWTKEHTQRLNDFNDEDIDNLYPTEWYMKVRILLGIDEDFIGNGDVFLHGLEPKEYKIVRSLEHRYSHESVGGTTGAGKGRKLSFDIIQAIVRKEGVIVIDPKKDENLLDIINATLKLLGEEHRLYVFTPAEPSKSCRINPYKNYSEITELTQRTIGLLGAENEYTAFAWEAVNTVLQGLNMVGEQLSLKNLIRYLQSDIDDLLVIVLKHYLKQFPEAKRIIQTANKPDAKIKQKAKLLSEGYEELIKDKYPNPIVDMIMGVYKQDPSFYKKLYRNIMSPLTQLTTGSIRDLLSPSKLTNDPRPVVDTSSIAHNGNILYVNLSSLRDKTVGNSIGSLMLADIISVVGDRYFIYEQDELIPLNVYGDESSDYVNDAAINVANKSRGSKTSFKFYFQTYGDLTERLGSREKAGMMIGNTNTQTTLRSVDLDTKQKYSDETKRVYIKRLVEGVSTQTTSPKDEIDYNTGYSKNTQEVEVPLISSETIGLLPDLHCFTRFPGGDTAKLRVPYISIPDEHKFKAKIFQYGPFGQPIDFAKMTENKNENILMVTENN